LRGRLQPVFKLFGDWRLLRWEWGGLVALLLYQVTLSRPASAHAERGRTLGGLALASVTPERPSSERVYQVVQPSLC